MARRRYKNEWIGVSLSGTLSQYDSLKGSSHLGLPVQIVAKHVSRWHSEGRQVRIFSPRARDAWQVEMIHDWQHEHGLPILEVTDIRDRYMLELWSSRAARVEKNTGVILGEHPRKFPGENGKRWTWMAP